MSAEYPEDLYYSKEHEWARIEVSPEKNIARIGITRFAVDQLGDVTQVELPEEGTEVTKDEAMGTIESVKAVSDVFAPLSGKIVRTNSPLHDSPEYLNDDPYDEGWLVDIEMSDRSQVEELMSAQAYRAYVAEQE